MSTSLQKESLKKQRAKASQSALKKRGYHHGDLRYALMQEALAQIAAHGAHSLSLREVARRAGVSHTASYRHFRSKDDLLAAIAEQGFTMFSSALSAAIEKYADNAMQALQASGIAYVEFGVRHPEHLQVMFGGLLTNYEEWPVLQQAADHAYKLLSNTVRRALQSGQIRGDESTISLAAWSLVHGLTQLIVGGQIKRGKQQANRLANGVTRLFRHGLEARRK